MNQKKLIFNEGRTFLIAEISANHNGSIERAIELIHAAKAAGANAVKIQTYTADTLTLNCDNEYFRVKGGTLWDGKTLHELYQEAYTPWEWQPKLKKTADAIGLELFSSPFDATSVDFLEQMGVNIYKIASFELVDIPLLKKVAATGKPVIMSTGMATLGEIDEAVRTLRENGCPELALLKCVSGYPAKPEEMNLRTIPHLAKAFNCVTGISDHSLDIAVPITAVALGARIIEKHFTLSRGDGGPDAAFSLEPQEFKAMAYAVRSAEKALGDVSYDLTEGEKSSIVFRRSLFIAADIAAGEAFTTKNVRSVRPGNGLPPRYLSTIIGKRASRDLSFGTPLTWDDIN